MGRGQRVGGVSWVAALVALVLGGGCGEGGGGAEVSVADAAGGETAACPSVSARPGGGCCLPGQVYHYATDSCFAVGPAGCGDSLLTSPGACTPRWCHRLAGEGGADCLAGAVGCLPEARDCTEAEIAARTGCRAGWWPGGQGKGDAACLPAGGSATGQAATGETTAELTPVAAPVSPRWCEDHVDAAGAPCASGAAGCLAVPRSCGVGEVAAGAGCPAGEVPTAGPDAGCRAPGPSWVCPVGFVADEQARVPAGQLVPCKPDPGDCGSGTWPDPGQATPLVHVRADAAPGGDGSPGAPFRDLKTAVAQAKAGATVLLAAGSYAGPITIAKPLSLRGRCAAMVAIAGGPDSAALGIQLASGAGKVAISGLRLGGGFKGLVAMGPAQVEVTRVMVHQATGLGVGGYMPGLQLTLDDVVVSETLPVAGTQQYGTGLEIGLGARLEGRRVRLTANRAAALHASTNGARVSIQGLIVDGTRVQQSDHKGGNGIVAEKTAQVRVDGCALFGNAGIGLGAMDAGSAVWVRDILMEGPAPGPYVVGSAASAEVAGAVHISGGRLSASLTRGLRASGKGSLVRAVGVVVHKTLANASGAGGEGAFAIGGSTLDLRSCHVQEALGAGVKVQGAGSSLLAHDLLVTGTRPQSDTSVRGGGLELSDGAVAEIRGLRVHDCRVSGVFARDPDTHLWCDGCVVTGTEITTASPLLAFGMFFAAGARAALRQVRLSDNRLVGLAATQPTTAVRAAGLVVDRTHAVPGTKLRARGVLAEYGATLDIWGGRISGNDDLGVATVFEGSALRGVGLWIDGTRGRTVAGQFGQGAVAHELAELDLRSSVLSDNRTAGVTWHGAGGALVDVVVRGTGPAEYLTFEPGNPAYTVFLGEGVLAAEAGHLKLERCLLHDNARAGLFIYGGSDVTVKEVVTSGNLLGVVQRLADGATLQHNSSFGNEQANTSGGEGLTVPKAPDLGLGTPP